MANFWKRFFWIGGCTGLFLALLWRGWEGFWDGLLVRPGAWTSDYLVTYWPNMHYIKTWFLKTGRLPQWRAFLFSGTPLVGDPQSGLAYPLNALHLFLPETAAFNLLFWFHVTLGATGMSLLARAEGIAPPGQGMVALAFMLFPRFYAHWGLGHVNLVYAMAYIPWVWMGWQALGKPGAWKSLSIASLAWGWQAALHPQVALYTGWAGLFLYPPFRGKPDRSGHIGQGILFLLFSFLSGAGVFFPLIRQLPYLARTGGMEPSQMHFGALRAQDILGILLPDYGGYADGMLYFGVPLFLLSLFESLRRPTILLGSTLMLAYGWMGTTPWGAYLLAHLPLVNWVRVPGRIGIVLYPMWLLMAAHGWERWTSLSQEKRRQWQWYGFLLPFALGLFVGGFILLYGQVPTAWLALWISSTFTWWVLGWGPSLGKTLWQRTLPLLVLLVVDLALFNVTLVEARPLTHFFRLAKLSAFLKKSQEHLGPLRVYSPTYSLPQHEAARWGIEMADGVDPLYSAAYDRFMEMASGVHRPYYSVTVPYLNEPGRGPILQANRDAQPRPCLLGLLNVRYVLAPYDLPSEGLTFIGIRDGIRVYENSCWKPRAFLMGRVRTVDTLEQALSLIQQGDTSRFAVVEKGPAQDTGWVRGSIQWETAEPDVWQIQVTTDRPALLILSLSWHPDWKAWVDGQPTPVYRTNGTLLGVYLSPGTHRVELRFHSTAYTAGMALALVTYMLLLGVFLGVGHQTFPPDLAPDDQGFDGRVNVRDPKPPTAYR